MWPPDLPVEEACADVRQVAAVGEIVVVEEVGDPAGESDSAVVAHLCAGTVVADCLVDILRAVKKCQPGGKHAVGPARSLVLAHRVRHDADAAKGIAGLKCRRPLEKLQMPHARPGVHRARLTELADAHRTQDRDLLLLPPDVEEARPADLGKVKLDREVGELGQLAHRLEPGAAEADAVLDVAIPLLAGCRLAEKPIVYLEEAAHPDQWQLLALPFELLQARMGLVEADVEVADLIGIENRQTQLWRDALSESPSDVAIDVSRLTRIEGWRPERVGRRILGEPLPAVVITLAENSDRGGVFRFSKVEEGGFVPCRCRGRGPLSRRGARQQSGHRPRQYCQEGGTQRRCATEAWRSDPLGAGEGKHAREVRGGDGASRHSARRGCLLPSA